LNKAVEEKAKGGEEQDKIDSEKNQNQEQWLSLSTQAYKLFSEGKTTVEVVTRLNLRVS
jgi:hypothetical protein